MTKLGAPSSQLSWRSPFSFTNTRSSIVPAIMTASQPYGPCPHCSERFAHKSSLARHIRRCQQGEKTKSRRTACQQCCFAKAGCDGLRPRCSRCDSRNISCSYESTADSQSFTKQKESPLPNATILAQQNHYDGIISNERFQILSGDSNITTTDASSHFSKSIIKLHMSTVKSWARLMATHGSSYFPPFIHPLQSMPESLANCYTLVKMWSAHTQGSVHLVQKTLIGEVHGILRGHHSLDESDLLASAQSLLLLLTILMFDFGDESILTKSASAQLLIEVWEVKRLLAATGLYLDEETNHCLPRWESWAMVSAKRRTIMALHRLEYSWSLLNGYPIVMCWELNPLPAPAARYLWQANDRESWTRLYEQWLQLWRGGIYKMNELLRFHAGGEMDDRSELWYAEADEFGLMLVAEARSIAPQVAGGEGDQSK